MEKKNLIDKFSALMDKNIKGVQYGVYAIAGLGFCIAMRSVRPFKKFRKPSDIPKHFLEKNMKFSGKILRVQGGKTPMLFIDHYPVIALPLRSRNEPGLPVQISSIEVTPNGIIWLSSLLKDSDVSFIPIKTNSNAVESVVFRGKQNVGEQLVSIGFATAGALDFSLDKNRIYSNYYKSLIASERKAEYNGAGVWQNQRQVGIVGRVQNIFSRLRYGLI